VIVESQRTAAIVVLVFVMVLLACVGVSISIFKLQTRRLKVPADPTPRQGVFFLHYLFREWWYYLARPIVSYLARHGWNPNALTYLSLVLACVSAVLFATAQTAYAGFVLLLSGACDSLDGWLARETAQTSRRGAFLDSSLDRIGEILVFIGLCVFFRDSPFLYAVLIGLGGAVMVSYTRARGHSLGVDFDRGIMQRPERIVYLASGGVLDPLVIWVLSFVDFGSSGWFLGAVVVLVAVLSLATAVYRVAAIARRLD